MRKWQFLVVISVVFIMVLGLGWAPEVSAKKYKWRMTQVMPEDSDAHLRATAFANEVKVKQKAALISRFTRVARSVTGSSAMSGSCGAIIKWRCNPLPRPMTPG